MAKAIEAKPVEPDASLRHAMALAMLEEFLSRSVSRMMFSAAELQDLALDLHNVLDPISEGAEGSIIRAAASVGAVCAKP